MAFSDFCDNSRKLNRILIVGGGLIITGMLLCVPMFKTMTTEQKELLITSQNVWMPIFAFVVGWLFKSEPVDKK